MSKRLKPFYETPKPGQKIQLIEEDATLKQGDSKAKGTVTVTQEWSPMGLYWSFVPTNAESFKFEEVEIIATSFKASGVLFSFGPSRLIGFIKGKIEIGSDEKLDRVTFHLPNYPDFMGTNDFHDELTENGKTTNIRWQELILEADGWRIILQPYRDAFDLRQQSRESQKIVLSGVGEISRVDGSKFQSENVKRLLDALRIFLSFSYAEWCPPLLVVGSNDIDEKSWQLWGSYEVMPYAYLRGWLDECHGDSLSAAFPGFWALWIKKNWQEPLELVATWLIETSRQSGGTEGAIAFGQIPLELLAWLVFVDDGGIESEKLFNNHSAAIKMEKLLKHCAIPLDVPPCLGSLCTLATKTVFTTGPQLATKVRNTIIHPNEKNRKALIEWEKDHGVKVDDVRWETQKLFKWYITLIFLKLIGYSGKYANRLSPRKFGDVENVPWSIPDFK